MHGWCIAGGTDLVLNADLIVSGESARFGYPPARVWGIPEAPWLWVARLGLEQAKRYLLTGDEITAEEAARLGLVLECVPDADLLDRATGLAQRMARLPLNQLQMLKLVTTTSRRRCTGPTRRACSGRCSTAWLATPRKGSTSSRGPRTSASARRSGSETIRSATTAAGRSRDEGVPAMSEVTSYELGVPCWVDAQSSDVPASVAFYAALFGWEPEGRGEDAGYGTMFRKRGLEVAAIFPLMAEGMQPRWTTYLATDDVDGTAGKVQEAGGVVFQGPLDVFDSGRMAIVSDSTGTVFGVWEGKERIGARLVNEPGTIVWNELNVRDIDTALTFYRSVFGIQVHEVNVGTPEGPVLYRELQVGGRTVAGATQMTDDWPEGIPSHWSVCFAVEDADAAAAAGRGDGGHRARPADRPPTRALLGAHRSRGSGVLDHHPSLTEASSRSISGRRIIVYVSAIAGSRWPWWASSRFGSKTTAMNASLLGNALNRAWSQRASVADDRALDVEPARDPHAVRDRDRPREVLVARPSPRRRPR